MIVITGIKIIVKRIHGYILALTEESWYQNKAKVIFDFETGISNKVTNLIIDFFKQDLSLHIFGAFLTITLVLPLDIFVNRIIYKPFINLNKGLFPRQEMLIDKILPNCL